MFLKRFAGPTASALRVQSVVGLVGVLPVRFVAVAVTWRPAIMFDKAVNTSVLALFTVLLRQTTQQFVNVTCRQLSPTFVRLLHFMCVLSFFLRHFMLLPVAGVLSLQNEIRQWQLTSYQSLSVWVCVCASVSKWMYVHYHSNWRFCMAALPTRSAVNQK